MICGDLDLERARRDDAYRTLAQAFLVLGARVPEFAFGFSDMGRPEFSLRRLSLDDDEPARHVKAR